MKKLRTFAHHSEANLAKSLLASHGIDSKIVGAKEYVAHVMGGDLGRYDLFVPGDDFTHAATIINQVLARDTLLARPSNETNHFRKAVMFAIGAPILIPGLFNAISLYHGYQYWEKSEKDAGDLFKVALILILQLPTYFILKYMWGMFGDLTSLMQTPEDF